VFFDKKLVLIGNLKESVQERVPYEPETVALIDPKTQKCQVLPLEGFPNGVNMAENVSCYWKDSKIIVIAGNKDIKMSYNPLIGTITLENLDSNGMSSVE